MCQLICLPNPFVRYLRMASLQPILHQFRGPSVQLVGPSLDVGEYVGDPGQVVKVAAAAVPRRDRIRGVVGTNSRVVGLKDPPDGGLRFRVGVDGQVAVYAEVPDQEVPGPSGQGVRGEPLEWEWEGAPLVDRR